MAPCRCNALNVLSGEVARDYTRVHLDRVRTDGLGRPVHRCSETGIEWAEERAVAGYGDDTTVLRRVQR